MTDTMQDFETYCGNTESATVPITDALGADYTMTGAVVTWVLLHSPTDTGTAILSKTMAVSGHDVTFALTHAETSVIDPGTYWHEATAVFLSGEVHTLWTGWAVFHPARSSA
jgi:hypothetical protein